MNPNYSIKHDYYPFGMQLEGRHGNTGDYRYGFQGQEKDDEVSGEGNSYTAEYWQYDSRLGRRWNIDPVVKHHESPYATFANNPIWFIDPNGADSSLAGGSRVWAWETESGDTYSSISSRTGVSIQGLRDFNPSIQDDHKIPTGTILNLSDPSNTVNTVIPSLNVDGEGVVSFKNFDITNTDFTDVSIIMDFTSNSNDEYTWSQTFTTNDEIKYDSDGKQIKKLPNRGLNEINGNDKDAGVRAFNFVAGGRKYFSNIDREWKVLRRSSPNSVGFLDAPMRNVPTSGGTITWNANLVLQKKVDNTFVTVTTFSYGFKLHSSGKFEIVPLKVNNDKNK